ncbi:hypothetical protein D046_2196A, partial [Vibrio parahaemolyticus V-223/04]
MFSIIDAALSRSRTMLT